MLINAWYLTRGCSSYNPLKFKAKISSKFLLIVFAHVCEIIARNMKPAYLNCHSGRFNASLIIYVLEEIVILSPSASLILSNASAATDEGSFFASISNSASSAQS